MAAARHWVEELFPPAFGIEVEGLNQEDKTQTHEPNVYKLAATPISRFDPSTIKNVYERVWLMTALEDEEQKRRKENEEAQRKRESELHNRVQKGRSEMGESQQSVPTSAEQLFLKDKEHLLRHEKADINNSRLWSSDEIEVLRKVFSTARSENSGLRASLNMAKERIGKLERLAKKQTSRLEEKDSILSEAKKANARLQLVVNSLRKEVDQAYVVNDNIEDELKELREENALLTRELHEVRSDMESERIRRKNVEIDLGEHKGEAQRQLQLREESLALRHEHKVTALTSQLGELQAELEKERKDHDRTKRGLEHLRNHFSALPYSGHAQRQGMVTKDELHKWTY